MWTHPNGSAYNWYNIPWRNPKQWSWRVRELQTADEEVRMCFCRSGGHMNYENSITAVGNASSSTYWLVENKPAHASTYCLIFICKFLNDSTEEKWSALKTKCVTWNIVQVDFRSYFVSLLSFVSIKEYNSSWKVDSRPSLWT